MFRTQEHFQKHGTNDLLKTCYNCRRLDKIYKDIHSDQIKERVKEYIETNKEHIQKAKKVYREANKEHIRYMNAKYRQNAIICECGKTFQRAPIATFENI